MVAQIGPGPTPEQKYDYRRKEEIIYDGKRYRIHNNYLTLGGGFLGSSLRNRSQQCIGIDYQFHIVRQHFQIGFLMSGDRFLSNNNLQGHVAYGYRKETKAYHLAAFAGPSLYTGHIEYPLGAAPTEFYQGVGAYACIQAVNKFTFDVGIGAELFGEISKKQSLFGFKIMLFFSGAYKGPKRNYNPNVRAENP